MASTKKPTPGGGKSQPSAATKLALGLTPAVKVGGKGGK